MESPPDLVRPVPASGKLTRKGKWVLFGILLGTLLAYPTCSILKVGLGWPSETTNVWQYRQIRAGLDDRFVSHFPGSIPWGATNAQLYYSPGFLQGGTEFQVGYELKPEDIKALASQWRQKAKAEYAGGEGMDYVNKYGNDGYPIPSFRFGRDPATAFPPAYSIFVIDAWPYHPGNWNHGHTRGVAVNEGRNYVIYWMESW